MKTKREIMEILELYPQYRERLFAYGFIFSNQNINSKGYPFYGDWVEEWVSDWCLLHHKKINSYIEEFGEYSLILIGHAYNPFTGEYKEREILHSLGNKRDEFLSYFNQLTGVFTLFVLLKDRLYIFGDPAGMQSTFYMSENNTAYVSTHENLIGDVLDLKRDNYVSRLTSYKYYPLLGNSLPGDITQFSGVKRVIPNHCVEISDKGVKVKRFFAPKRQALTKFEIAKQVSAILENNISLIAKKWDKPAISLTGGCDSKTTLACTFGNEDKFQYFSYVSSDEELADANAAAQICEALDLNHNIYNIPKNDEDCSDIEIHRDLLFWNTGGMRENNLNDVRKRVFFTEQNDFDVEVKSWASEIGRAYYSKRFNGRKKFGKITPRKCTTLYKFFLHNRRLVKDTDTIFKEYIEKYLIDEQYEMDWQELFFWEFRMSSWNGLVITGEHRYSFDITIPYNNRLLLELLLSASLDERIYDEVYKEIRLLKNSKIDETGISVVNIKHTAKRAKFENLYYAIHSKIPF